MQGATFPAVKYICNDLEIQANDHTKMCIRGVLAEPNCFCLHTVDNLFYKTSFLALSEGIGL